MSGAIRAFAGAPADEFWIGTLFTVGIAVACAYFALRHLHTKRLIENTPRSLLRSAAQGYVELQGTAELLEGEPILARLSGQACTWFSFRVERKETTRDARGRSETRWRTLEQGRSEHLFLLRDESGSCVVDPDGAQVSPSSLHQWYGNTLQAPRLTRVPRWLVWSGLAGLGRQYRYTEERIDVGVPLYALGLFRSHTGADPVPQSAEIGALLGEWKRAPATLLSRFDANRDGQIDAAEWELARTAAKAEIAQGQSERCLPPAIDTLVDPRDSARPYVLAAATEQDLVQRARWRVAAFGTVAFATTLLVSMLLSARFGA